MGNHDFSAGTVRELERLIQLYSQQGIAINYSYVAEDELLSIVIWELVPQAGRYRTESDLWNLALSVFRSADLLKEIRAEPVQDHVVEKRGGELVFRRLITPEINPGIRTGEGPYEFVIRGRHYHLEVLPEFNHDNMVFFAMEARAAIQRQGLADQLP